MKTASPPRLSDRYIRSDDFAARIESVELPPEVWAVFAQLAQPRSASELAHRLKLDPESINAAIRRLVRRKLIRKHVLGWRDYSATEAVPADSTEVFSAPSARVVASAPRTTDVVHPRPARPVPPGPAGLAPASPAVRSPIISLRISSPVARPAPAISLRIASRMPAPASTPDSGLRLRPVLDAIGAKAGGGVAGQLLVYRVFLQIPTELMRAAGLNSLNLVDDQFTLRHPELRAALADTARRHAGVDIEALAAA
jgi:hypothetical protein